MGLGVCNKWTDSVQHGLQYRDDLELAEVIHSTLTVEGEYVIRDAVASSLRAG